MEPNTLILAIDPDDAIKRLYRVQGLENPDRGEGVCVARIEAELNHLRKAVDLARDVVRESMYDHSEGAYLVPELDMDALSLALRDGGFEW